MNDLVLSLMVLAVVAMIGGAWIAWRRQERKRAGLMLILAVVLALNVAIWTVPPPQGTTQEANRD